MAGDFILGEVRAIPSRGLEEATCKKFGYRIGENKYGKVVQIADHRGGDGNVVAQHIRGAGKTFSWIGDAKQAGLWGMHLWPTSGRRIVITEGEIDAMSVAQVFNLSWPVVSLPGGADGAVKAIKKDLDKLLNYAEVIIGFDMDEPGQKAAREVVELGFAPGQCKIVNWGLKDANELLQADRAEDIRKAVYGARVYRPDGIVTLDDIEDRVMADVAVGRPYPWDGPTAATFGRRLGDVIGLGAGSGCGKTDVFTSWIEHDVMNLGITTGVLYLEQGVAETGRRIAGKLAGRRFHVPDGSWTHAELKAAWGALKATNRLHLYDNFGAIDWDTIQTRIRYMIHALGCEHIYLDHLTALAAASDDEKTALERIMAELAGIAKDRAVIHYVSHLATPEGKPHEEGGRVMGKHFKGSRAIMFWSHMLWGLERNTQAPGSPVVLRCLKDRFTGQATGKTWGLAYDASTGLLSECELPDEGESKHGFKDESNNDF
jgi:twinkle protein